MAISTDEKIDWFRIIVVLCNRHGYTEKRIGGAVDTPRTTVQGWKMGATPKYEDGERLIVLWEQVTGESRETVPKVKRYSHLA
jgi:hypothetical protein